MEYVHFFVQELDCKTTVVMYVVNVHCS